MKTEIIPYEPIHALTIIDERVRKHDLWLSEIPGAEEMPFKWAEHPASTLVIDDKVIICGGIIMMGWRRGEVWGLFADDFRKYPIAVFKACKSVIERISKEYHLRRLQTTVDFDLNGGRAFVERLGFEEEGLMKAYGPHGEDCYMFSKIIGEL